MFLQFSLCKHILAGIIEILVGTLLRRLLVDCSIDALIMDSVPLNLETFYINFVNGGN